jgi:hypothetical protein
LKSSNYPARRQVHFGSTRKSENLSARRQKEKHRQEKETVGAFSLGAKGSRECQF